MAPGRSKPASLAHRAPRLQVRPTVQSQAHLPRGSRGRRSGRFAPTGSAIRPRPVQRRCRSESAMSGPSGCRPSPRSSACPRPPPIPRRSRPLRRPRWYGLDRRDAGRRRQRFRQLRYNSVAAVLEPIEYLQQARAARSGLVFPDVQVGYPFEPELPEPLADERHRTRERAQRLTLLFRRADGRHPHVGVTQVGCYLDVSHCHESDPGIIHLAPNDGADLFAKQLIEPRGAPAHRKRERAAAPKATAEVNIFVQPAQAVAMRETICLVKDSMMSPSSTSLKSARPIPHS